MGGSNKMEQKVFESIGLNMWPWVMTLTLDFQGQIVK